MMDNLDWIKLVVCVLGGGCSVHYRMFSSVAGLYPIDTNSTTLSPHLPSVTLKMFPDIAKHLLGIK